MKNWIYVGVAVALVAIGLYFLIPKQNPPVKECVNLCKQALIRGENLTNGPCLANPLQSNPDWVCDVAHSPRQPVDNLKENQCSAYGKTAKHFIEVTPNCQFIRAV